MPRRRDRKVLYEVTMESRRRKNSESRLAKIFRKRAFRKIKSGNSEQNSENSKVKTPKWIDLSKIDLKKIAAKLRQVQVPPIAKYLGAAAIVIAAIIIFAGGGDDTVDETGGLQTSAGNESIEPEIPFEPGEIRSLTGGENVTSGENKVETPVINDPGPPKDHFIVIASFKNDPGQLKPVAEYFASKGIETEIQSVGGNWYRLITKERFVKPNDPLSQIDDQKQRISVIGKGYKPPDGFLRFKFDSVYPEKLNN